MDKLYLLFNNSIPWYKRWFCIIRPIQHFLNSGYVGGYFRPTHDIYISLPAIKKNIDEMFTTNIISKFTNEDLYINGVNYVIHHEMMHRAIHSITNKFFASPGEEKVIDSICGLSLF